jgi:beta-glucosidase
VTNAFPPRFVWGVATAAYQIEGATREDGRGESIWDRFCATPGKVWNGQDGSTACDFYHRYQADVELMHELGVDAFRFSIAWPRIVPEGRGRVNPAGLDFYDRLVDELLAKGIVPYPTLYHWDLPQALEDRGGWRRRETAEVFAEYAEHVVGRIGDRIERWVTVNEPWVVAWIGHGWGKHAPGCSSRAEALAAGHHLLLSHALASSVIRRDAPGAQVGIVLDLLPVYPATDSPPDHAAAAELDGVHNRWFLDALFRGRYPSDALEGFAPDSPPVEDGDLELISRPMDFLGVNNYTRQIVRARPGGGSPVRVRAEKTQHTATGWEVYPDGLHDLLVRIRDDYAPQAVYVTENGAAFDDVRDHAGRVRDPERRVYLESHIGAVGRAIGEGVPVEGYFVWSLLDNFEWADGYSKRFGIVYVDYPTLERVPKESFYWYRDFIAAQRGRPGYATRPRSASPAPRRSTSAGEL